MGWPFNIPIQPEIYNIFLNTGSATTANSNRWRLQQWADANLKIVDANGVDQFTYTLGDFIWFLKEKGSTLTPPVNLSLTEAQEWLDILDDHFERHPRQKARIERFMRLALFHKKKVDLQVEDGPFEFDNTSTEPSGGADGVLKVKSPRGRHRRRFNKNRE